MIYKIENGKATTNFDRETKYFIPNDSRDIRNFAVTLLYPNECEQILRNRYLKYHIDYLMTLYKSSNILNKHIPYLLQEDDFNHYKFDLCATKHGNSIIYCNDPNKPNLHEYAFYLSNYLTPYQKEFFNNHLKYFLRLQKLTLFLYQEKQNTFEYYNKIDEYRSLNPYQALKRMIQK